MNGLENVKKGDKVVGISYGRCGRRRSIYHSFVVDHVTKTLVVGTKLSPDSAHAGVRIETGKMKGDKWGSIHYYPEGHPEVVATTQETTEAMEFDHLKNALIEAIRESQDKPSLLQAVATILEDERQARLGVPPKEPTR